MCDKVNTLNLRCKKEREMECVMKWIHFHLYKFLNTIGETKTYKVRAITQTYKVYDMSIQESTTHVIWEYKRVQESTRESVTLEYKRVHCLVTLEYKWLQCSTL